MASFIETDAVPDSPCSENRGACRVKKQDSGSYSDDCEKPSRIRYEAESAEKYEESSAKQFEEPGSEEFKKFIRLMPPDLKCDNFEILILYNERDISEVKKFQRRIQRDCFVSVAGERRHPVVKLEDDCKEAGNPAKSLDFACQKALYIFLFTTQNFCEGEQDLLRGYACLTDALENRKWSVIPVYTEEKENRTRKGYKLPMMLRALQSINYWDRHFFKEAVSRLLESKVHEFEDMNDELDEERKQYYLNNKDKLKERYRKYYNNKRYPVAESEGRPDKRLHSKHSQKKSYPIKESGENPEKRTHIKHSQKKSYTMMESGGEPERCTPESHSEDQSQLEYTSSVDHCGLKSYPDDSEIQIDVVPRSPEPLTNPDSGLPRYTGSLEFRSSRQHPRLNPVENSYNFQSVANTLPNPSEYNPPVEGEVSIHSNSDASMEVQAPSSLPSHRTGGSIFHQGSFQNFRSEPQITSQSTSSYEHQSSDSKNFTFQSSPSQPTGNSGSSGSSAPENAQSASQNINSGGPVVHTHIHHHNHIQIDTVEYLALGPNAKIDVMNREEGKGSDDDDDKEDPDISNGDDTEKKVPSGASLGSENPSNLGAHEEDEETIRKKVSPDSLQMGYPELPTHISCNAYNS